MHISLTAKLVSPWAVKPQALYMAYASPFHAMRMALLGYPFAVTSSEGLETTHKEYIKWYRSIIPNEAAACRMRRGQTEEMSHVMARLTAMVACTGILYYEGDLVNENISSRSSAAVAKRKKQKTTAMDEKASEA